MSYESVHPAAFDLSKFANERLYNLRESGSGIVTATWKGENFGRSYISFTKREVLENYGTQGASWNFCVPREMFHEGDRAWLYTLTSPQDDLYNFFNGNNPCVRVLVLPDKQIVSYTKLIERELERSIDFNVRTKMGHPSFFSRNRSVIRELGFAV